MFFKKTANQRRNSCIQTHRKSSSILGGILNSACLQGNHKAMENMIPQALERVHRRDLSLSWGVISPRLSTVLKNLKHKTQKNQTASNNLTTSQNKEYLQRYKYNQQGKIYNIWHPIKNY